MAIIYFLIGLGATILGAIVGLGGGVIIKPVLDSLGNYNLETINVLSSFTVLSMAIVSVLKQIQSGIKLEKRRTLLIAVGSILGGIGGKYFFNLFMNLIANNALATAIQAIILALLLSFILAISVKPDLVKTFDIHNNLAILLAGIILGFIAAFLGIGGGPINVAFLILLLNMDNKKA
ncbi:MAG: sulfite exporter TauE/SafE family protein, partial [Spirochaetes bacterium]|nr:sulfite exporter TauE/SafE family protein [Spirochaetota bacterium]